MGKDSSRRASDLSGADGHGADLSGADGHGADGHAADDELGYEQARDELIDVVRQLEAGGATLEESLALWERGERLAAICQQRLDGARARLQAVSSAGADAENAAGNAAGSAADTG